MANPTQHSVGNGGGPADGEAAPSPSSAGRRKTPWPLAVVAVLFVVVPFLTWYLTWFGRALSDADMGKYLSDERNVRHVQQALTQVEAGIEKGDASVRRWYPQVVALTKSPIVEIRKT